MVRYDYAMVNADIFIIVRTVRTVRIVTIVRIAAIDRH